MCHFMFWGFIDGPRWALMGLAVKLAQSVSYGCCIAPTGDSPPFLVQVGLRASSTLGARVAVFADTSPALLPR